MTRCEEERVNFNTFPKIRSVLALYKKVTHKELYDLYLKTFGEPSTIQSKEDVLLEIVGFMLGFNGCDLDEYKKLPRGKTEDLFQSMKEDLLNEKH